MAEYRIAEIPGDGIGVEVTAQARKALDAAATSFGFSFDVTSYDLGGTRYLSTGEVLADTTMEELRGHDAIMLGAIGLPAVPPGVLERGLLLKLRFAFDQYVNLRPVKLFEGVPTPIAGLTPDRCDFVVVRENTEGPYVGIGGSAGGHLSLLIGLTDKEDSLEGKGGNPDQSSRVQCVVNVFGVTDMTEFDRTPQIGNARHACHVGPVVGAAVSLIQ